MAQTKQFRGEGGKVWRLQLPLSAVLTEQVERGLLVPIESATAGKPKEPTPKERLQADAAALGLDPTGTVAELTARIDAEVAELRKQAAQLGIDDDNLSAVELSAAIDAKLTE